MRFKPGSSHTAVRHVTIRPLRHCDTLVCSIRVLAWLDLYNVIIVWESLFVNDLLIMSLGFSLLHWQLLHTDDWILNYCLQKTPRSGSSHTDSNLIPSWLPLLLPKCSTLHLSRLKSICQPTNHRYIAFKSLLNCSTLCWYSTFAKTLVSDNKDFSYQTTKISIAKSNITTRTTVTSSQELRYGTLFIT